MILSRPDLLRWNQIEYGKIEYWDVSRIIDMKGLFDYDKTCNPDISPWDISQVMNFKMEHILCYNLYRRVRFQCEMVASVTAFNQNVGEWDASSGTDL